MEKPDGLSSGRVECGNVAAFMTIAKNAGVGQILKRRYTAMLAADEVVNLMRKANVVFVNQALLASVAGAACDFLAELIADVIRHGGHKRGFAGPWLSPFLGCARVR